MASRPRCGEAAPARWGAISRGAEGRRQQQRRSGRGGSCRARRRRYRQHGGLSAMKLKVQTRDAKAAGDLELNDEIYGLEPRADILFRVVKWQLANIGVPTGAVRSQSHRARPAQKRDRQRGGDKTKWKREMWGEE